jgi:hypothetical protein
VSDGRRLWIRSRVVQAGRRPAYREAVIAAGVTAGEFGAHCWVFEADGSEGRFIEFFEGPSDDVVAVLLEAVDDSLRGAGGSEATDAVVGPPGLKCTEFG